MIVDSLAVAPFMQRTVCRMLDFPEHNKPDVWLLIDKPRGASCLTEQVADQHPHLLYMLPPLSRHPSAGEKGSYTNLRQTEVK